MIQCGVVFREMYDQTFAFVGVGTERSAEKMRAGVVSNEINGSLPRPRWWPLLTCGQPHYHEVNYSKTLPISSL